MDHGKNDLATLSESVASISKGRFLPELGSSETTKCGGTKKLMVLFFSYFDQC